MARKARDRLALAAVALALAAGACGDDGGPGPDGAAIELGSGRVEFSPLADGDELGLIEGIQGGHHFVVHARVQGIEPGTPERLAPDNPVTRFQALDADGTRIDAGGTVTQIGYRDEGTGWFALPSGRLLIMDEGEVPELYGEEIVIRVIVTGPEGATATDERRVLVVEEVPRGPDAGAN